MTGYFESYELSFYTDFIKAACEEGDRLDLLYGYGIIDLELENYCNGWELQ